MIKTLRESKAELSELVDMASRGQDVLISVRGTVKARLTRATAPARPSDRALWVREMRRLQKSYSRKVASPTVNEIPAQQPDDGTCYCDTSALLKLYIAEADSPHFLQLIADGDEPVVSSAIVTAEILCVLCRKEQARALKGGGAIRIYAKFSQDVRLKQ